MSSLLAADSLSKSFRSSFGRRRVDALVDFSLSVDTGEIFGLLGPNGAGKTTFIKIVLGLVHPSAGSATIAGVPVSDWRARLRVGYLPENHRFPEYLTARQMLVHFARLSSGRLGNRDVEVLLDRVGMLRWADTPIRKFSKGMLQRVGIAHALANDPMLIFLDEPTDGVDPVGRKEIRSLLESLRNEGKTIFLNSHILSELELICSRIAILNHGKLVAEGQLDELLSRKTAYTVTCTPIPTELLEQLAGLVPVSTEQKVRGVSSDASLRQYELHVSSRRELNDLVDRLRQADIDIETIQRKMDSLEELFVRTIGDQDKPSLEV